MGFNPPVPQQDSNWEIRVTILLSLMFQVVLVFAGPLRKRSSSPFIRFVIWSCYLLADWVADLSLGLLLNNMGNIGGGGGGGGGSVGSLAMPSVAGLKHVPHGATATSGSAGGGGGCGGNSSSPIIFAFWAPFLLLHLGGPDTITAYSLEDNELWLRHLIGFLFELSAAAVVFFCSLGDNPMIVATPIMFIAGIIKYVERTYSLYCGSSDGFPVSILGVPDVRSTNIPKLMQAYSSRQRAGLVVELTTMRDNSTTLWGTSDGEDELNAYELFVNFRAIFVNGVVSTRNQKKSEEFYLALSHDPMKAFHILELELNYMYDMLYTKMPVLSTTVGYVMRFISYCCLISSFIIFGSHNKASMLPTDIGITYTLLAIAVALEVAALVKLLFSNWTIVYIYHSQQFKYLSWLVRAVQKTKKYRRTEKHAMWSGIVWQMNLIEQARLANQHKDHHSFLFRKVANGINKILPKSILDHIKKDDEYIKKGDIDYQILLNSIFERIQEIVTRSTTSEGRKKFYQTRGEGALRELVEKDNIIFKSVSERDFDESLLMWHIATDLCYSIQDQRTTTTSSNNDKMKKVSKCLSEYLLHLLIKKPEMVVATMGIGQLRYNYTYEGAKLLFRSNQEIEGHASACKMVLDMHTTTFESRFIQGDRTKTVLLNACILAKALMNSFIDPDGMWRVIGHVWMEMLMFTAARTQPKEHLKKLSNGGELLTLVWFLMAHMGMTSSLFEVQETESINKLIIHDQ